MAPSRSAILLFALLSCRSDMGDKGSTEGEANGGLTDGDGDGFD